MYTLNKLKLCNITEIVQLFKFKYESPHHVDLLNWTVLFLMRSLIDLYYCLECC